MNNLQKILIIGKHGQIAWELQRTLSTLGQTLALGHEQLDLSHPQNLITQIHDFKPTLIVNSAAYTAVDLAEKEKEMATAINATAPRIMAEEAYKLNATFIHYSTDYVFNGNGSKPYLESDATDPINEYGRSKRKGEEAILAVGGKSIILRTSWIYGMRGKNFLLTMLRLANERPTLKIVDDQIGAPTWSRHVAEATAQIAHQATRHDFQWDSHHGIYHLTASGETSWYRFAKEIFAYNKSFTNTLIPITSAEYPVPAKRPAYSRLDCDKVSERFGVRIPSWEEGLKLCLHSEKQA